MELVKEQWHTRNSFN